jgi:hypothetical protein
MESVPDIDVDGRPMSSRNRAILALCGLMLSNTADEFGEGVIRHAFGASPQSDLDDAFWEFIDRCVEKFESSPVEVMQ